MILENSATSNGRKKVRSAAFEPREAVENGLVEAIECPPLAASTSPFSTASRGSNAAERTFFLPFEVAEFSKIMWPPPTAVFLALHYVGSSPGIHHEMEWFLHTIVGVTRNTTFG